MNKLFCYRPKGPDPVARFKVENLRGDILRLGREYPGARVAMEVGTHSPWVSRLLGEMGLEVIVANARKLRAIYGNERKSDRADAEILARVARVDPALLYGVEHGSEEDQRGLLHIKGRDVLVRQRVNIISSVRFSLKSLGIRLDPCSPGCFAARARVALGCEHPEILSALAPSLGAIEALCAAVKEYDAAIVALTARRPEVQRLRQIAGVGPVTALCFTLVIGNPERFRDTRDVGAYLGLVPRRDQSGDTDKQLGISKAGNPYLRRLLVQCATYIIGPHGPESDLRRHGLRLAARGGTAAKKRAAVAVARKLSVVMLALWKAGGEYLPLRRRGQRPDPRRQAA